MKKILLMILLATGLPLLTGNNNLQQQLAQLEINLSALKKGLGPLALDTEEILISTVDEIEKFEQLLEKLVQEIGLVAAAIQKAGNINSAENEVITFIETKLTQATNELIKYINLLPQAAQANEQSKKTAKFLLDYLERKYSKPITADYLLAFAIYTFQSDEYEIFGEFPIMLAASKGNTKPLEILNRIAGEQGFEMPETLIFVDYNIDLNQDLSAIRNASAREFKKIAFKLHPDKNPVTGDDLTKKLEELKLKTNKFMEERFKVLSTDLQTMKQNDDIAEFIIEIFKSSLDIGKEFAKRTPNIGVKLEQLRAQLYQSIKKAQDAIAKLP